MGLRLALGLALAVAAGAPARAQERIAIQPPPPPAAQDPVASGETMIMRTKTGELRWAPGDSHVSVFGADGARRHRIPLARPDRKRRPSPQTSLRALLPSRGGHFLVVEETRSDVGLHLHERLGTRKPKATVVRSVLRLVEESSRIVWERPTEDKTLVGDRADAQHLQIAPNGAVALLLQDVDPYSHNRPLLTVIDPRGREALRLDYTAWARVDEFALSADGRALAVHGFGIVPDEGEIARAVGYYKPGKGPLWIKRLPRDPSPALHLETVDAEGWACCVRSAEGWAAYDPAGSPLILGRDALRARFGVTVP
ncbi:MAG: hypothetical protein HY554_16825 [Elusimicrobia bacterium]|nr:hypothetical protein [Elusimicrobiota bacterium]